MQRLFLVSIICLFLFSCDDGDIIVSDFNFDQNSALNLCEFEGDRKVLHIVTESNEAISLIFDQNILENVENVINPETFSVTIDNSNRVNYRRLNGSVDSNIYFCQEIPPSEPTVIEEFTSTTGGNVEFTITRTSDSGVDTDGDGIDDIDEQGPDNDIFNYDTDGDGLPNFLDIDDDNDNVLTNVEIEIDIDFGIELDTDGDGIPDYLDPDDDGDGVVTRYEDLNAFEEGTTSRPVLNPLNDDTNDNGIPNYLDETVFESLVIDIFRENRVSRQFNITVVFNNITLENITTQRTIRLNSQGFGVFTFGTNDEVLEFR
ncbi:hypothetical protein [Psychroflexus sp. MES1-P1E]|uniref:hypothetical protein n=1 Tax=Psychroflexus sp. MES1-P1E TaxID=2058320 RepID=UPI000C79B145|nr:hypothetical protein [Psychroflexus sp. MES1-P1E]PKG42325.1 hypothetical protein CXF67_10780 [Psychroflexus sp. MES1-P1E]